MFKSLQSRENYLIFEYLKIVTLHSKVITVNEYIEMNIFKMKKRHWKITFLKMFSIVEFFSIRLKGPRKRNWASYIEILYLTPTQSWHLWEETHAKIHTHVPEFHSTPSENFPIIRNVQWFNKLWARFIDIFRYLFIGALSKGFYIFLTILYINYTISII